MRRSRFTLIGLMAFAVIVLILSKTDFSNSEDQKGSRNLSSSATDNIPTENTGK